MKKPTLHKMFAMALLLGGSTLGQSFAQKPKDPFVKESAVEPTVEEDLPKQIGILLEWIELDAREANKLVRKHAGRRGAAAMREEVEAMIDAETAVLFDTNYLVTRSGQRAKTESVNEIISPSEYDPSEIPATLTLTDASVRATGANPTAFKMRPAGGTLEVDPVIGVYGSQIELNIAPEWVSFVRRNYVTAEDSPNLELKDIWLPEFYSMKVSTAVTLRSGVPELIAVMKPEKDGNRRMLLFVQADTMTLPNAVEKP
jgi:hypothetical protein